MTKISSLSALTGAGVDTAADLLPVVDMSEAGAARNKKITVAELLGLAFSGELVDDRVAALLVGGSNVTLTYDDTAGTLTIAAATTSGSISDFNEAVDDRVAALIHEGPGITKAYDDTAGSLVISAAASVVDNDVTLASDSTTVPPSQHAVKTYVASAVTGLLDLKGGTDCSANPNYPSALKGDAYYVTVAGKIGGASGTTVAVGDVYFATADNAGGTQASVGSSWDILVHASVSAGGGLLAANNLSDLASATTALTNLGLTANGKSLVTAANYAAMRTLLGLVIGTDVPARSPSIQAVTSSATVTPTFADDQVNITAQAAGLTLANPTGTAVDGWGIAIRIKDNGTARAISFGTQYRALGVTLPTTTVVSKTLYLGCIWNVADTKFDVVAVAQEA